MNESQIFYTSGPALGPIFTATYECDDACCGEGIQPGEDIRADGSGGWIHADDSCEAIAGPNRGRRERQMPSNKTRAGVCESCFCVHAGEC